MDVRTFIDRIEKQLGESTETMEGGNDGQSVSEPRDGARVDRTVTPISRRVVDVAGERVRRLAVRGDDGERFAVLVSPAPAPLVFVEPGRRYRLAGLLWSAPPTATPDAEPCPACGGPLRPGCAADGVDPAVARAAARLEITEPFGVVDDRTVVERPDEPREEPVTAETTAPRTVCDGCGYRDD